MLFRKPETCMSRTGIYGWVQGRARAVGQVLLGWYEIPTLLGAAINIVVNPGGADERAALRHVPCALHSGLAK